MQATCSDAATGRVHGVSGYDGGNTLGIFLTTTTNVTIVLGTSFTTDDVLRITIIEAV